MERQTLVLNRLFRPIRLVDWRRAMQILWTGRAVVVDGDYRSYSLEQWLELSESDGCPGAVFIRTPSRRIALPEVIALLRYERIPPSRIKFTRRNIYEYYGYRCCYCGEKMPGHSLNLDHVVPLSRGGKTTWSNVVVACEPCNRRKGNRTPQEAGMRLILEPSRPGADAPFPVPVRSDLLDVRPTWRKFLTIRPRFS